MRSKYDPRPESGQAGRENAQLGVSAPFNTVHPEVSLHVKLGDVTMHGSYERGDLRGCMLNTFTEVTVTWSEYVM